MLWMLPKCIVFNGVAVFKTPACAKDDRIVQFSEILHITIVTARYGLRLGSTKRASIELALALTGLVDTASIRSSIEHNTFWQHPEHPNVTSRVN